MKNKKASKKKDRINRGMDSRSNQARVDRGTQMGKAVPTSTLYATVPQVKSACDVVMAASSDLATKIAAADAADLAAAQAHTVRDDAAGTFDTANAVCASVIEHYAALPADIQGTGYTLLIPNNNGLAMPLGMTVQFDVVDHSITVLVQLAAGLRRCVVEWSSDPNTPTSWQRLDGDGLRRKLTGFAPGTYWFRAATVRATAQSGFCAPVAVAVK